MTTVSETITSAYRESNLRAAGQSLTTAQETEGLTLLLRLLPTAFGQEAGQELAEYNVGGPYDDLWWEYAPENARLVLNLSGARTIKLSSRPYDGQRLAIVDTSQSLATYNLTLDGDGRRIEGVESVVLNTNGARREWFYRADLGEWLRIDTLELADDLPFPTEFDDYWSSLLAMRLNPRHGREMAQSSATWLQSMANRLEARYRRQRGVEDDGVRVLGPRHGFYGNGYAFNRGRGW
jgi:hypothetical protein